MMKDISIIGLVNRLRKWKLNIIRGWGLLNLKMYQIHLGKKLVEYEKDENTFTSMQKAFHKKHSDSRKEWLADYSPESSQFSLDEVGENTKMSLTDFVNEELIKFSHADCERSIPNLIDGLKESQRKLLYAVKKRKLKYTGKSLKVAQLGRIYSRTFKLSSRGDKPV